MNARPMFHIHPSVTESRIVRMVKSALRTDGGQGLCLACGRKAKGFVEPDAEHYTCGYKPCGQQRVYGAEQVLLIGAFHNG